MKKRKLTFTGLNSNVVATGKCRIHIKVKFSMQSNADEEVATDVIACNKVPRMEEEEDYDEQGSSVVVTADAMNSFEGDRSVSREGQLEEGVVEECGSSESKNSSDNETPSEIHTCPECLKTFPSCKSLYSHLRLHPNRGYPSTSK